MTTIEIRDVGSTAVYRLDGRALTLVRDGGCADVLTALQLSEDMTRRDIADVVEAAWCEGYDGDPEENGLTVEVKRT